VLINLVLTCLPMLMLSFFEIPKGILEKIEYYRSQFFWQNDSKRKNIDSQSGAYFANQRIKGA
jgi:hypothetical protein